MQTLTSVAWPVDFCDRYSPLYPIPVCSTTHIDTKHLLGIRPEVRPNNFHKQSAPAQSASIRIIVLFSCVWAKRDSVSPPSRPHGRSPVLNPAAQLSLAVKASSVDVAASCTPIFALCQLCNNRSASDIQHPFGAKKRLPLLLHIYRSIRRSWRDIATPLCPSYSGLCLV